MVITGLVVVLCSGKTYLGKKQSTTTTGWITLVDALEILTQYVQSPRGPSARVTPVPISPMGMPTEVLLKYDGIIDVAKDPELGSLYKAMTGQSGIILPGLG